MTAPLRIGVLVFPGSNCDRDCHEAVTQVLGAQTDFIWHKESTLPPLDAVIIPGGFSYGDYLRTGAIARFSPVMTAVTRFAEARGPDRLPLLHARRPGYAGGQPQWLARQHRGDYERRRQRPRDDASSGALRRRPPRQRRRTATSALAAGCREISKACPGNDVSSSIKDLIAQHGLTEEEYQKIITLLGREPNLTEMGMFSVMWSEHCSYKSSRAILKRLPTEGPHVIQGPGENAGVVDIGDGLAAVFKMESHNHPSFIEPYQGAATGVGGILRDIFTMGARPIALLDSLRFGPLDQPRNRYLLSGVVAGIAGYGNCIGVPTVGGEVSFNEIYNHNPLVNVFCLGIARADRIFRGRASGVGNPVIYIGSKTGRDGIHGATMASDSFDEGSESKRPTVQVGDPFTEKLLLEACLELMEQDLLVGLQDMGAAGLTSSSCEMASRAGTGIELELANVPRREAGMTPYEVLLSESEERMLLVAKRGREGDVLENCKKRRV